MFLNLLLLFMCLNLGFGLMHVPGHPLTIPDSYSECMAQYEDALDDGQMKPISGTDSIGSELDDIAEEMRLPTNSTSTTTPPSGDGTPFNAITESIEASYKTMETMKNFITGGYVMNVLENLHIQCDNRPTLDTEFECGEAYGSTPYDPITYTFSSGASITYPCENPTFGDPIVEPVWLYFRGGIEVLISFLLIVTLFYFITGRGTFLSN